MCLRALIARITAAQKCLYVGCAGFKGLRPKLQTLRREQRVAAKWAVQFQIGHPTCLRPKIDSIAKEDVGSCSLCTKLYKTEVRIVRAEITLSMVGTNHQQMGHVISIDPSLRPKVTVRSGSGLACLTGG